LQPRRDVNSAVGQQASSAVPLERDDTMRSDGKNTLVHVAASRAPVDVLIACAGCRRQRPAALHLK
jgi:hypothetical protein